MWITSTPLCITKIRFCRVLDYTRNFGSAAKEGLKRTSHWAAYYFTNPKSWYPVPEGVMFVGHTCHATFAACTNGTTARAEHEGLGANVWCSCVPALCQTGDHVGKSWNPSFLPLSETSTARRISFLERSNAEEQQENGGDKTEEDGVLEYDSPSCDEDVNDDTSDEDVNDDTKDDASGEIPSLDAEANFLLGTVSHFGRTIRFNNIISF